MTEIIITVLGAFNIGAIIMYFLERRKNKGLANQEYAKGKIEEANANKIIEEAYGLFAERHKSEYQELLKDNQQLFEQNDILNTDIKKLKLQVIAISETLSKGDLKYTELEKKYNSLKISYEKLKKAYNDLKAEFNKKNANK